MNQATQIARILVRVTGLIQIVLGLLFWLGIARALIPVHILSGLLLVLSMWALALIAARSSGNQGLALANFAWGILVVALGLNQAALLPGPLHWVIQVVHLLVGLAAIGMANQLAARLLGPERMVRAG